jgi:hypothetical protein
MTITKKQNRKLKNRRNTNKKNNNRKKQKGGNNPFYKKLSLKDTLFMVKFAKELQKKSSAFIIVINVNDIEKKFIVINNINQLNEIEKYLLHQNQKDTHITIIEVEDYQNNKELYEAEIEKLDNHGYECNNCNSSEV